MKTLCGFIGWIVGMFVGFMFVNSVPALAFICIIGSIPLGKFIGVLFDDVRTTGNSLEQERRLLEGMGTNVICAITIAQTTR